MRKKIYLAIIERLKGANIGIERISLWNNNVAFLEKERAFKLPAVFIQFEPIRWGQLQQGVRSADVRIRLHIVTDTLATPEDGSKYQEQALEHLDLIENVGVVMQGFCGDGFNGFMLVESVPDHDHAEVLHNEEVFITRVTDSSAKRPAAVISAKPVVIGEWIKENLMPEG